MQFFAVFTLACEVPTSPVCDCGIGQIATARTQRTSITQTLYAAVWKIYAVCEWQRSACTWCFCAVFIIDFGGRETLPSRLYWRIASGRARNSVVVQQNTSAFC